MSKLLLIGSDVAVGSATNPANVPNGAIAVFKADGGLLTAGETIDDAAEIYLCQGVATGLSPVITARIQGKNIKKWDGQAYNAATRKIQTLGFIGGSNTYSLPTGNSTSYSLIVMDTTQGFEPYPRYPYAIKTDSTATPFEVGDEFCLVINETPTTTINEYKEAIVYANVIVDVSSSAIGGSETLTVTDGSAVVTSSGTSHALVAGDYVRIGSATDDLYPVYKVSSVDGATITLTRPFRGTSASGVAAGELSAAPTSSDEAGIQFISLVDNGNFEVSTAGSLEGTPLTNSTALVFSNGTGTQVSTMERKLLGMKGIFNTIWYPQNFPTFANTAYNYDLYTIEVDNSYLDKGIPTASYSTNYTVIVALKTAGTNNAAFEGTLNPYMNSVDLPSVNL